MKSKKIISFCTAMLLTLSMSTMSVFAHGSNHKTNNKITYSKCNVANCKVTTNHTHNGKYYYGHNANDGHTYHKNIKHH